MPPLYAYNEIASLQCWCRLWRYYLRAGSNCIYFSYYKLSVTHLESRAAVRLKICSLRDFRCPLQ